MGWPKPLLQHIVLQQLGGIALEHNVGGREGKVLVGSHSVGEEALVVGGEEGLQVAADVVDDLVGTTGTHAFVTLAVEQTLVAADDSGGQDVVVDREVERLEGLGVTLQAEGEEEPLVLLPLDEEEEVIDRRDLMREVHQLLIPIGPAEVDDVAPDVARALQRGGCAAHDYGNTGLSRQLL